MTQPPSSRPDTPRPLGIAAPGWRVGDGWVVRYRVKQPTPRGDLQPVEILWKYTVVDIDASGRVDVLAHRTSDDIFDDYHLYYDRSGALLRYDGHFGGREVPPEAYLPVMNDWNAEALPKDWPGFPLEVGKRTRSSEGVSQEVFEEGAAFRVVLRTSGTDPGVRVDKTMTQVWETGRPWWSSLVIESDQHLPAGLHHSLDIEGVVVDWQLATRSP